MTTIGLETKGEWNMDALDVFDGLILREGFDIHSLPTLIGPDWDSVNCYAHDWSGKTELARPFVHGGRKLMASQWHGEREVNVFPVDWSHGMDLRTVDTQLNQRWS